MICAMTTRLFALALGMLFVSGCAAQAPVDTTADETTLKEITQTWLKSYNGGDADTIGALYAEEAVLMPPHAPVARGRAAIREFVAKDSAGAKSAGIKLAPGAETVVVNGDWGWNSGSYTVQDGSGKTVDSGSYLSVSHKVNGKWLYVRDTYNSDQPLPPPPPAK
jgi:ketosteroid isomerase-like protein